MNFKSEETQQKLSGSYYTPPWIADYIMRWVTSYPIHSILEPSCGDGVFFDVLNNEAVHDLSIKSFDIDKVAVEVSKAKQSRINAKLEVRQEEFIGWALKNLTSKKPEIFDAAVGNPPFIRYQYLDSAVQLRAEQLFNLLHIKFTKHTNAWIPFVIACIEFLAPGGRIGMVIPSEILHVLYAKELRSYLLRKCSKILMLDPEDIWFEDTLQGAMVLMAEKKGHCEDACQGVSIIRTHGETFTQTDPVELFEKADYVYGDFLENKWTYALLTSEERAVFSLVRNNRYMRNFAELASVDIGIVTGANRYFLVTDDIVNEYNLQDVAQPMFGRSEHCPGIVYNSYQHRANKERGVPTNFLWFDREDSAQKHTDYILMGEQQELQHRFKCRIRTPWYKVSSVYASPISMLKRSNGMPRLILNELMAYTTDTAYRIMPYDGVENSALVRCFLNTVTALSAELEGRHYGGGVLEIVPSEIAKLLVPYIENEFIELQKLDEEVRNCSVEDVLDLQDERLFSHIGIGREPISILRNALFRLMNRRQRKTTPIE